MIGTLAPERVIAMLAFWHETFNVERFGGALATPSLRVSGRMKTRLGHYSPKGRGKGPEIAISLRHLRTHGAREAAHTLLHEMVHQWQHESGLPLGHGAEFRRKALEVGVVPRARRRVD